MMLSGHTGFTNTSRRGDHVPISAFDVDSALLLDIGVDDDEELARDSEPEREADCTGGAECGSHRQCAEGGVADGCELDDSERGGDNEGVSGYALHKREEPELFSSISKVIGGGSTENEKSRDVIDVIDASSQGLSPKAHRPSTSCGKNNDDPVTSVGYASTDELGHAVPEFSHIFPSPEQVQKQRDALLRLFAVQNDTSSQAISPSGSHANGNLSSTDEFDIISSSSTGHHARPLNRHQQSDAHTYISSLKRFDPGPVSQSMAAMIKLSLPEPTLQPETKPKTRPSTIVTYSARKRAATGKTFAHSPTAEELSKLSTSAPSLSKRGTAGAAKGMEGVMPNKRAKGKGRASSVADARSPSRSSTVDADAEHEHCDYVSETTSNATSSPQALRPLRSPSLPYIWSKPVSISSSSAASCSKSSVVPASTSSASSSHPFVATQSKASRRSREHTRTDSASSVATTASIVAAAVNARTRVSATPTPSPSVASDRNGGVLTRSQCEDGEDFRASSTVPGYATRSRSRTMSLAPSTSGIPNTRRRRKRSDIAYRDDSEYIPSNEHRPAPSRSASAARFKGITRTGPPVGASKLKPTNKGKGRAKANDPPLSDSSPPMSTYAAKVTSTSKIIGTKDTIVVSSSVPGPSISSPGPGKAGSGSRWAGNVGLRGNAGKRVTPSLPQKIPEVVITVPRLRSRDTTIPQHQFTKPYLPARLIKKASTANSSASIVTRSAAAPISSDSVDRISGSCDSSATFVAVSTAEKGKARRKNLIDLTLVEGAGAGIDAETSDVRNDKVGDSQMDPDNDTDGLEVMDVVHIRTPPASQELGSIGSSVNGRISERVEDVDLDLDLDLDEVEAHIGVEEINGTARDDLMQTQASSNIPSQAEMIITSVDVDAGLRRTSSILSQSSMQGPNASENGESAQDVIKGSNCEGVTAAPLEAVQPNEIVGNGSGQDEETRETSPITTPLENDDPANIIDSTRSRRDSAHEQAHIVAESTDDNANNSMSGIAKTPANGLSLLRYESPSFLYVSDSTLTTLTSRESSPKGNIGKRNKARALNGNRSSASSLTSIPVDEPDSIEPSTSQSKVLSTKQMGKMPELGFKRRREESVRSFTSGVETNDSVIVGTASNLKIVLKSSSKYGLQRREPVDVTAKARPVLGNSLQGPDNAAKLHSHTGSNRPYVLLRGLSETERSLYKVRPGERKRNQGRPRRNAAKLVRNGSAQCVTAKTPLMMQAPVFNSPQLQRSREEADRLDAIAARLAASYGPNKAPPNAAPPVNTVSPLHEGCTPQISVDRACQLVLSVLRSDETDGSSGTRPNAIQQREPDVQTTQTTSAGPSSAVKSVLQHSPEDTLPPLPIGPPPPPQFLSVDTFHQLSPPHRNLTPSPVPETPLDATQQVLLDSVVSKDLSLPPPHARETASSHFTQPPVHNAPSPPIESSMQHQEPLSLLCSSTGNESHNFHAHCANTVFSSSSTFITPWQKQVPHLPMTTDTAGDILSDFEGFDDDAHTQDMEISTEGSPSIVYANQTDSTGIGIDTENAGAALEQSCPSGQQTSITTTVSPSPATSSTLISSHIVAKARTPSAPLPSTFQRQPSLVSSAEGTPEFRPDVAPIALPHRLLEQVVAKTVYCHQCRSQSRFAKMKCTRMLSRPRPGKKVSRDTCGTSYCHTCILKRYPNIHFDMYATNFTCPRCLETCNCTACCGKRRVKYESTRRMVLREGETLCLDPLVAEAEDDYMNGRWEEMWEGASDDQDDDGEEDGDVLVERRLLPNGIVDLGAEANAWIEQKEAELQERMSSRASAEPAGSSTSTIPYSNPSAQISASPRSDDFAQLLRHDDRNRGSASVAASATAKASRPRLRVFVGAWQESWGARPPDERISVMSSEEPLRDEASSNSSSGASVTADSNADTGANAGTDAPTLHLPTQKRYFVGSPTSLTQTYLSLEILAQKFPDGLPLPKSKQNLKSNLTLRANSKPKKRVLSPAATLRRSQTPRIKDKIGIKFNGESNPGARDISPSESTLTALTTTDADSVGGGRSTAGSNKPRQSRRTRKKSTRAREIEDYGWDWDENADWDEDIYDADEISDSRPKKRRKAGSVYDSSRLSSVLSEQGRVPEFTINHPEPERVHDAHEMGTVHLDMFVSASGSGSSTDTLAATNVPERVEGPVMPMFGHDMLFDDPLPMLGNDPDLRMQSVSSVIGVGDVGEVGDMGAFIAWQGLDGEEKDKMSGLGMGVDVDGIRSDVGYGTCMGGLMGDLDMGLGMNADMDMGIGLDTALSYNITAHMRDSTTHDDTNIDPVLRSRADSRATTSSSVSTGSTASTSTTCTKRELSMAEITLAIQNVAKAGFLPALPVNSLGVRS